MSALWADDRDDGYLTDGAIEAPLPAEPLRGESDVSPEHYPEGDPYTLYEQDDLYDDPTPHGDPITARRLTISAICAGVCAAVIAAGVAWLIVRSRRRESPVRRAAKQAARRTRRQFSERSRRAAAHGSELVEPFEQHARRGAATTLATSRDVASRLRRRAGTLRRR